MNIEYTGKHEAVITIDWPEPEPMPVELRPVLNLDTGLLPVAIREWVKDIAKRQSSPIEFPVATAVVMMGTIIGTKIGIQPKRNDTNWIVIPNMWGAGVGNPSLMKTPSMKEARLPFKKVDAQFKLDSDERLQPLRVEYRQKFLAWDSEDKAIRSMYQQRSKADMGAKAARGLPDRGTLDRRNEELQIEKEELDALKAIAFVEPCMEINDATPEKLQVLQASNPNGILMFRDEVAGWLDIINKPERAGERRYYLEGWSGDDSSTQHRISRDTNEVQSNCISIFGSMQPSKVSKLVSDAQGYGSHADGLLQRFQILVWCEDTGLPQTDSAPDTQAQAQANDAFMRLYNLTPEEVGCIEHERFPHLRFTSKATRIFLDWVNSIQAEARQLEPALQSHLVKHRSLAPSIALLFHLIDGGYGEVPAEVLNRAIGICEWLWSHAQRVYASGHYSHQSSLVRLCQHIMNGDLGDEFTQKDAYKNHWSGITTKNVSSLLDDLVEMNWVSYTKLETGGRPTDFYQVNPKLKNFNSEQPENRYLKSLKSPINPLDTLDTEYLEDKNQKTEPLDTLDTGFGEGEIKEKSEHTNNSSSIDRSTF